MRDKVTAAGRHALARKRKTAGAFEALLAA
jgi:hypothetical protein